MTQHELQNDLKMSLGTPPGPKVAKVGSRTPYTQSPYSNLVLKRLQNGVRFEANIESKIVLISGVEKVGDPEDHRVAKRTLGTSKNKQIPWRGEQFHLFALFGWRALFD